VGNDFIEVVAVADALNVRAADILKSMRGEIRCKEATSKRYRLIFLESKS